MAEIGDLNVTDASNTERFPENQAASSVNDGARALEGLLARGLKDTIDGIITTGGTNTAYTAASNRTITTYYDGLTICLQFHTASGASPTLNVDSVAALSLVWPDGVAVALNDVPANSIALVKYDLGNTNWVILTSPTVATQASLGLVIGTNVQAHDDQLDDIAGLTETKGMLITNTGAAFVARSVGSNGQVLTADSTESDGVKWADPAGILLQRQITEYTTYSTHTTTIPKDDTIPQNTEGEEIMARSITPKSASNRLLITVSVEIFTGNGWTIALFQDATANALSATGGISSTNFQPDRVTFYHEMSAGTTSATTFKVRVGPQSATAYVNGDVSGRHYGGVIRSYLIVEEFAA